MSTATTTDLTVTFDQDEANAVVYGLSMALTSEGAELEDEDYDCPGALHRLSVRAHRIGAYEAIGRTLHFVTHWGPRYGDRTPPPVTAPESVWLEVLNELNSRADELRRCGREDADSGVFEFDSAARTVARAFAAAGEGVTV